MAEPGTGGQQCTVWGLTHWEVTQGRSGKKSLPLVSGQTELGRPLLHYSVEVRGGRMG